MLSSEVLSEERLSLMLRGADIYNDWLEQLLERGLTSLEKAPESFDLMAAQMIDHKLNGFATQLKMLGELLKNDPHWPSKIISELTLLQLATRRLRSWEREKEATKFDLLNVFGIGLKKEKLLVNAEEKCLWLVTGITENKLGSLNERKTYLMDQNGRFAILIDYLFGRQKVKPLIFGQFYDAQMAFYPGSLPLRVAPKTIFRSSNNFSYPVNAVTHLSDLSRHIQDGLIKNPWIRELPFFLKEVLIVDIDQQFYLKDKHGGSLSVLLPVQWGRRLALGCLESQLSIFGVWQKGHVQVLSAQIYGQYFMIN